MSISSSVFLIDSSFIVVTDFMILSFIALSMFLIHFLPRKTSFVGLHTHDFNLSFDVASDGLFFYTLCHNQPGLNLYEPRIIAKLSSSSVQVQSNLN